MKNIEEVLREMDERAFELSEFGLVSQTLLIRGWIKDIRVAMREPVAILEPGEDGDAWGDLRVVQPIYVAEDMPLFAFPPDRRDVEIERLKVAHANQVEEIKELRALLTEFNERYMCKCKHFHCLRCALNRKAATLLTGEV